MSGGGLAGDSNGNIFFATGNGTWNGTTDYGDSIVKLGPPSGGDFPVLHYFTPYNQSSLAGGQTARSDCQGNEGGARKQRNRRSS